MAALVARRLADDPTVPVWFNIEPCRRSNTYEDAHEPLHTTQPGKSRGYSSANAAKILGIRRWNPSANDALNART
ncbi:hypothetical protein GCM10020220_005900 [Nonomuraea rubra]